jgi:hypothetical protein
VEEAMSVPLSFTIELRGDPALCGWLRVPAGAAPESNAATADAVVSKWLMQAIAAARIRALNSLWYRNALIVLI